MLEGGAVQVGQISFTSDISFSYGTEIAVWSPSADEHQEGVLRILGAGMQPADVKVESGKAAGRRYIIMTRRTNGSEYFLYEAVPSEAVEREAETIEREVVSKLQAL